MTTTSGPIAAPVRRPALITLLVVLTVIGGISALTTGIIAVIAAGTVLSAGLVFIILGLVYLAVAKGLADGNSIARIVIAVVSVVQIAVAIFSITRSDDTSSASPVTSAVVSALILLILFSPKANAFFAARSR